MVDKLRKLLDRETRYELADAQQLRVSVTLADAKTDPIHVRLVNISSSGAQFVMPLLMDPQQKFALCIESEELDSPLRITAQVCWCRYESEGEWFVGCQFCPRLPHQVLAWCAKAGALERREVPREFASIEATAIWESGIRDESVRVVNIGPDGVCLISRSGGRVGAEIVLEVGEGNSHALVRARIVWQHRTRAGFATGCRFLSRNAQQVLRTAQDGPSSTQIWQRVLRRR